MLNDQTAIDATVATETAPETAQNESGKGKGMGGKGKGGKGKGKASQETASTPKSGAKGKGRAKFSIRQKIALGSGCVAVGLLGLSVVHLTEAITALTGSHWFLSCLLAIGIDAGMLHAEGAAILADERKEEAWWEQGYIWTAALASALLNSFAFSMHTPSGMEWTSLPLGFLVPLAVLALGKIGGRLWLQK